MEAGEILLQKGLLDRRQLQMTREAQSDGARLDQVAVQLGFLTEESALRALGEEVGLDFVDLSEADIDLSLLKTFPPRFVYRENLFPIRRVNGSLVVATNDPFNIYPLDELSSTTGLSIVPVLAAKDEIAKLIKTHLGVGGETIEGLIAQSDEERIELLDSPDGDGSDVPEEAREPSVVRLVNEILIEAIESRASDVHIESESHGLRIRYRIDGVLHSQPVPPEINRFQAAIISRLKIMSRLNIAEKRLPQDGRIQIKAVGREIDIRVSVIPMIHGEGIVMRILDKGAMEFSLKKLGMEPDLYDQFQRLIRLPHGIVLVTGPTGSGKTTTLYSALLEIRDDETKIITTEDPVEYQLDGISQIQVHTKIGFTFGQSLRSILRHDPDIVLVGEIRDLETAENAIQASLTGHLVFSTLHTNDAAGAYARLSDMGVESFLVASTVEAVMAQRLVRRLCPHCKQAYLPNHDELPSDFPFDRMQPNQKLYKPTGCKACRNVGYAGRMGIYELMVTTEKVRELAHARASSWEIAQAGVEGGMRTLRQDGWLKVLAGMTTVDEVSRTAKASLR